MKILHILDHSIPLHSGYSFRTKAILQQQQQSGWHTFQITSSKHKGARASVETVDGFTFYRSLDLSFPYRYFSPLQQWGIIASLIRRLDEIIPEIKPDILHAHSPALNGLAALKAARKYNLPLVYECRAFWEDAAVDHGTTTEHSLRYRLTRLMETYVFKRADAITTICEGLRADIAARGIDAGKITVIPNAVDIERFAFGAAAEPELKSRLGLDNKIVLGFIGSFYAYEGLPLLLEAMPKILAGRPEVRVLLVGGGPQEEFVKKRAGNLGLQDRVLFIGRVPHEHVQEYYNLIDVFVYPRLSMRLTDLVTPLKPLEAMAQGRLVAASDVGGHKELITDRYNGVLFKAGDAGALAGCILELLDNRQHWRQMKEDARTYVEQERNWHNSVVRYKKIYESLAPAG